jgi:hypothetical protein
MHLLWGVTKYSISHINPTYFVTGDFSYQTTSKADIFDTFVDFKLRKKYRTIGDREGLADTQDNRV